VLRGVWRFSGVFASAGIWRPRENGRQDAFCPARTVEKMGDRGRDASLRDTNAAHARTASVIR